MIPWFILPCIIHEMKIIENYCKVTYDYVVAIIREKETKNDTDVPSRKFNLLTSVKT